MKKEEIKLKRKELRSLRAGEEVFYSGAIYTARDQAHRRLAELIKNKKKLPFDLEGEIIYYCGPTATPKGKIIGSCGPTTSSRMDKFTPVILKAGITGIIGKGRRSKEVRVAIKKYKAVYFIAPSGCGALLAKKVVSKKLIAFAELGPEAIYELRVEDFPLIVATDSKGESIYTDF